jgi:Concanavalin A-like lectin/glucanases superfamily
MPISPSDIPPVTALLNQGLTLNGSAYALPSATGSLNPGNGTNPFTIHCWLLASTPSPLFGTQYGLFCNGEFTASASLVVGLNYDGKWFKFGVLDAGILYLGNGFDPNQWHHVAVTYDGNTLTIYDNGQLSQSYSPVTLPAIATPSPVIGACADSTVAGGINIPFLGQIQSLGIWPNCLSASDIQTYMTTPPDATTACLAFYDLGTPRPVNSITGSLLALYGGSVVSESFQAESAPAVSRRPNAVSGGKPSPTIYDVKPSAQMDLSVRPKSKVLSDDDIDRIVADYEKILSAIAPENRRAEFRTAFRWPLGQA